MTTTLPPTAPARVREATRTVPTGRQFVRFAFFRVHPAWRQRSDDQRQADRDEVANLVDEIASRPGVILRTYSLVGTRGDADFMVWLVSDRLEDLHEFSAQLNKTGLAAHLETPYHYFSMTKKSSYVERHSHPNSEGRSDRLIVLQEPRKYLFVYPFVKTRGWYRLSREERARQMGEHIAMGHRYPSVKINTTYSFGLDDQEFVVAFESDSVSDFLDLVQEMRESEASTHTVRDVPSFTCIAMSISDALAAVG
ncbi:MAG TPA: chlorite dismutase family protein [Candidatus Sulfotelmatobacter sp.]|nr:chlorite dismutase family protein [Candidatus Sulfotelmatobacter sp.]